MYFALANFDRPNVGLNMHQNIPIETIYSGIPLVGEIGFVPNVLPVRVGGPEAVIGIDNESFAMRAKHRL